MSRYNVILRDKNLMILLPGLVLGVLLSGCHSSSKSILSSSSFNFGQVVVSQTSTRDVVTVTNTGKTATSISAIVKGDPSLKYDPDLSCGDSLLPGGSCSMVVSLSPTNAGPVKGSLVINFSGGIHSQKIVSLNGEGVQLSSGQSLITTTANPVVALYSYQPTVQGVVHVEFGPDTNYGRITSSIATPSDGGPVQIFVAGMKQSTTYHMRAVVTKSDGSVVDDSDHTFTTGSFPAKMLPKLTVTTAAGQTPQPGIELINASNSKDNLEAYATDLGGNIIWGYNFPARSSKFTFIQPIKPLPNGNFIVVLGYSSQFGLPGEGETLTPADANVGLIREIDLAGDPVKQLTLDSLNAKLAAAGYSKIKVLDLHHDVAILPNGHFIVFGSLIKTYNNLPGYPGKTNVLGDILIDLDQNFNVSWVWNGFDHLDVNRHPVKIPNRPSDTNSMWSKFDSWMRNKIRQIEGKPPRKGFPGFEISFPDWTHSNAVLYSASDGDLLVSIRHQSWIIKIDYKNGKGSGDVLWRLGNGGDFKLVGGAAPEDWFYGQHQPSFVGSTTAGNFSLTMMDNGYGRITANGSQCINSGPACYSTIPVLAINEAAKTATIAYRYKVPAAKFNLWGGNAEVLANGDLEFDLCAEGKGSEIDEIKMTHPAQPVWTLKESGANLYRAHRIPSLYPGVQW